MQQLNFLKKELELKKTLVEEVKQEFEKVRKKIEIDKEYANPIKLKLAEKVCTFLLKKLNKERMKLINSYNEAFEVNSNKLQEFTKQGQNLSIEFWLEMCEAACHIYKKCIFEEIQDLKNQDSGNYLCIINAIEYAVNEFEKQLNEYFQKDIESLESKIKERENNVGSELCL